MRKIALILTLLLGAGAVADSMAAGVTFGQVVDGVDTSKNTKLSSKEYWSKVRDQEVTWAGEVYEVQGGKSRAKVYVADRSRPLYKGFNIVLVVNDLSRATKLRKGQHIRFKGRLDDFKSKRAGAVIELSDGQIL